MSDYIVRATVADANIRAFAVTSREMVETAREDHMTTPVMTAALGRLLSAGAMMGAMMKGDKDIDNSSDTVQRTCKGTYRHSRFARQCKGLCHKSTG